MGMILSVPGRETDPVPEPASDISSSSSTVAPTNQEEQYGNELASCSTAENLTMAVKGTSLETVRSVDDDDDDVDNGMNSDQEEEEFDTDEHHKKNQKKLEIFKQELASKREARQKAIAALTDKLKQLQSLVKTEEQARINAENEVTRLNKLLTEDGQNDELENEKRKVENLEKELENEKRLRLQLEKDKEDVQEKEHQIRSLKEVASIGKEMLRIRELQVNELKKKLCETQYPEDLREEYEAQIQNVRRLKNLYEERAEAVRIEHQKEIEREMSRIKVLETKITELERERKDAEIMREHLKNRVLKLDQELEDRNDAAISLQEQLDASVIECRDLASQMNLINNLFSQMLVGNLNLERITRLVEENQSLVTDLTLDDKNNDLAALLINIAKQLEDNENLSSDSNTSDTQTETESSNIIVPNVNNNNMTQQDVAINLSKVWRILVQLLVQENITSKIPEECDSENCYKSVETPSGKRSVISVSQTFLTLKNLILEKNALIKEVNKLKSLNEHLETRLGGQEKRLSVVSTELKKTWGVVSKLRAQHKQLHTQEKILKYELQHKRILLNDLKDELERCKEIWDMARKKNCQSEEEWRKLRKEFADRRKNQDTISNSAESGYEDDESNTPPTEDSIDDQELDRLVETECDTILLMNDEQPIPAPFINEINDSDNATQRLESINSLDESITTTTQSTEHHSHESTPHESEQGENNGPMLCQSVHEYYNLNHKQTESHDDQQSSDSMESSCEEDITSKLCTRLNGSSEDGQQNKMQHEQIEKENNQLLPTASTSSTAENISKFLEGLLATDSNDFNVNNEDQSTLTSQTNITNNIETIQEVPELENLKSEIEDYNSSPELNDISESDDRDNIPTEEICTINVETSNVGIIHEQSETNQNNSNETETPNNCENDDNSESEDKIIDEAWGYSESYQMTQFESTENELSCAEHESQIVTTVSNSENNQESIATTYENNNELVQNKSSIDTRTTEQVLDARTERLKRLEEQCKSLFNKVTATTIKSNVLSSKLELLHEQYGSKSSDSFDESSSTSSTVTSSTSVDKKADKHKESINRPNNDDDDDDKR